MPELKLINVSKRGSSFGSFEKEMYKLGSFEKENVQACLMTALTKWCLGDMMAVLDIQFLNTFQ